MLSNRVGSTGVFLYSNTPLLKRAGIAIQNTPVNPSQFDSIVNNGYDINASGSTDSHPFAHSSRRLRWWYSLQELPSSGQVTQQEPLTAPPPHIN